MTILSLRQRWSKKEGDVSRCPNFLPISAHFCQVSIHLSKAMSNFKTFPPTSSTVSLSASLCLRASSQNNVPFLVKSNAVSYLGEELAVYVGASCSRDMFVQEKLCKAVGNDIHILPGDKEFIPYISAATDTPAFERRRINY